MTDWNDPIVSGAEKAIDYLDGLHLCTECDSYLAFAGDTLCVYCRAEHPRLDSGLENIPLGANERGSAMPETWPAGNAEVVRATSAPSPEFLEDPRD